MFKGTPLQCWKERHEEAPVSAMKEGWTLPGDTQVLKPPRGGVSKNHHHTGSWHHHLSFPDCVNGSPVRTALPIRQGHPFVQISTNEICDLTEFDLSS